MREPRPGQGWSHALLAAHKASPKGPETQRAIAAQVDLAFVELAVGHGRLRARPDPRDALHVIRDLGFAPLCDDLTAIDAAAWHQTAHALSFDRACPIELGVLYEAHIDTAIWGNHFTSSELAHTLAHHALALHDALELRGATICDPAMGTGALLFEAAHELVHVARVPLPQAVAEHLVGMDRDAGAVDTARRIAWLLAPHSPADHFHTTLRVGDALLAPKTPDVEHFAPDTTAPLAQWLELEGRCDVIVANPPFIGGKRIPTVLGDAYADHLHRSWRITRNADLCTYFLLLAERLVSRSGSISVIATNSIAEGATREAGLASLLQRGFRIARAERNLRWPGRASVSVSLIHLSRSAAHGAPILDGSPALTISSRLRDENDESTPCVLPTSRGRCFIGCFLRGQGFVWPRSRAEAYLDEHPEAQEVLKPYLGGEEINESPTQEPHRYVIDFAEHSLERSAHHRDLLDHLERTVRPLRLALRARSSNEPHRTYWWRFANPRPHLRRALTSLRRCIVAARVTKHLSVAFQPTDRIFSEQVVVFAFDDDATFGILESAVHEIWVRYLSSHLGTGLRYTPSKAFETFPLPAPTEALAHTARSLENERRSYLLEHRIGLTEFKNRLGTPHNVDDALSSLRRLYQELDHRVLEAFGVSRPAPPRTGPETERLRFESEVLTLLRQENQRRASGFEHGRAPRASV